jgi:hypothetical protein
MRDKLYRVSENTTEATGAWQKGPRNPGGANSNSDMAVKAGLHSMDAAAKHDAQVGLGEYSRKPLQKPGRTRWNEN